MIKYMNIIRNDKICIFYYKIIVSINNSFDKTKNFMTFKNIILKSLFYILYNKNSFKNMVYINIPFYLSLNIII